MFSSQCHDNTQVFLRRNTLDKLEALRTDVLSRSAIVVQRIVRGSLTRVYYAVMKDEMTSAAVVLQRAARNLARRRYYLGRDRVVISAATAIQSAARGWVTRIWYNRHPRTVKMRSWISYREFEDMERDIARMKMERVALGATLDATRSELEDSRRNAECMQTELTTRLRVYETNAGRLREENMKLKSSSEAEAKVLNDSIACLKAELETLKETNRSLRENFAEAENERDEAARELGAIAATNSQLAEEKRQLNDKVSDLEQRNETLVTAGDELRDELRDARETANRTQSDLREEIESSRNVLQARETCHSEAMACLQSQLEKTRDDAARERREQDSKIKELESTLMLCEKEKDGVSAKLHAAKAEAEDLASALRQSREENDILKTCQADSALKVESLTAALEQEARAGTALRNELRETRESAEKIRTALNDELESSNGELRVLKTSIADELQSRQEKLSLARSQNGTLANERDSLKQTNAIMESRLKSLRENFEPLQSREDQTMEDMIHTIQRECSLLISKSQIAQEENLAMARRLESTRGQSAALECEVQKLSRTASKFSRAIHTIASDAEKVVGVVAEGDHCHKIEADRGVESGFEVSMI